MKILIATGIYPPDIGGPATWSRYFAEEFTKRGHFVNVLTYTDFLQNDQEKWKVYRVLRLSGSGIRHLRYFMKALSLMRQADITLLGDTISAGVPVWAASLLNRRPYVLKIGGDWVWEQAFQRWDVSDFLDDFLAKRYPAKIEFFRWLQLQVARCARAVLTPSRYLESVATRWGVPPKNVLVVYNNVRLPKVLSRGEAKRKLGIFVGDTILLSAGRNVPWKGFEMLERIMPNIKKEFPNVKFLRGIDFSKDDLALWLAVADIFLLNTAYEGFSHQILEAMALGVPVITTDAGGNKEILAKDETALLVPYNSDKEWTNTILKLIKDKELQKKLSENGRRTAEKFLSIDTTGETLKILKKYI